MLTLIQNLDLSRVDPILVLTAEGALAETARESGIEVKIIPLQESANKFGKEIPNYSFLKKLKVIFSLLNYNYKVYKYFGSWKPDFIYCNDLRSLLYAGMPGRLRRKPVSWYIRADKRLGILNTLGTRLATRIILIADGVKRAFTDKELRKFRHKFTTLHTGFSFDHSKNGESNPSRAELLRKKLNLPHEAFLIGLIGSISPRKGHHIVADVIPAILNELSITGKEKERPIHIIFAGDAIDAYKNYLAEVQEMIENSGYGGRFHWIGYQKDISPVYQSLDLLILPSNSEGLPRTVIEALETGLPVLISDAGGSSELVRDKGNGRLVNHNNREEIKNALIELYMDEDLNSPSLKIKRREFVVNNFSIKKYETGFMKIVVSEIENNKR